MADLSFVACNHETLIKNSTIPCARILNQPHRRYRKTIDKRNIPDLESLLEKINEVVLSGSQPRGLLEQLLHQVGLLSLCGRHHRKYVDGAVKQWLRDFSNGS